MSGPGAPDAPNVSGAGRRLAVVAARWHADIVDALVHSALAQARESGVADDDVRVLRVPGAVELPVVADAVALSEGVDGIVALGVVVRGATPHFDYVCRAVTDGLSRVALDHGIPVGFGVLTVDDVPQALARTGKGREAVLAVLETLAVLDGIRR